MEEPRYSPASPNARPRFRIERILFPLVFALVVLALLADKIPAVRDAREKLLHPGEYQALKACQAAALAAAERPAYARIVNPGEAHATQGAQYVEGVRVGEMGQSGTEITYDFSCYVEPDGRVIKSHKQQTPSARTDG
ncbi:MAG: hypothetical protein AB1560_12045 [Pseudomonadota bacterium]